MSDQTLGMSYHINIAKNSCAYVIWTSKCVSNSPLAVHLVDFGLTGILTSTPPEFTI